MGYMVKLLIKNSHRMWNTDRTRIGTRMEHGWNTDGTRIGTRNADGTRIEHGLEKGPALIDQEGSHENQPNMRTHLDTAGAGLTFPNIGKPQYSCFWECQCTRPK